MDEIAVKHKTSNAAPNVCVVRPLHRCGATGSATGRGFTHENQQLVKTGKLSRRLLYPKTQSSI
ncbi:hypothetical protein KQ945_10390, partial [Bacillus subtilis subsp. subtilis]|nr:hypothetical protein [Bacillus subtilis subsp. subtilis]